MLQRLTVENYALIEKLDLEFSPELNIITGETGAGKSILLGALGLLLGNRCDSTVLRNREHNCIVEGTFDIKGYELEWFFDEHDLDYDQHTVIRRVISPVGKSRCYINDLPVQQTALKELSTYLLDIHSQHQNQLLADERFRIAILDAVSRQQSQVSAYTALYHQLRYTQNELDNLREQSESAAKDADWLRFQIEQLESATLRAGEQEELESLRDELTHSVDIRTALLDTLSKLDADESGVLVEIKGCVNAVSRQSAVYSRAGEFSSRLESVFLEIRDISDELYAETSRIEADPSELEKVENRLDLLYSLQQKHGASDTAQLLSILSGYRSRLSEIETFDETMAALEKKISDLHSQASRLAGKMTLNRTKAAQIVIGQVKKQLAELGISGATFIIDILPGGLRSSGNDQVTFRFSANPNSEPAPVEKTASGGEISRLMLALKTVLAESSELPTIVFDEIDTGVSGRIADAMGTLIENLSGRIQIINITHLPQIASKGRSHFFVYKEEEAGQTNTKIKLLDSVQRIAEIAKMLSGSQTTEAAVQQARLLLGYDNK